MSEQEIAARPWGTPLSRDEREALLLLILRGVLVPVQVFGTDSCCQHGEHTSCPSTSYGLCDRFSTHSPAGSDCNRANWWLMRPVDEAMDDPELRAEWERVLDE